MSLGESSHVEPIAAVAGTALRAGPTWLVSGWPLACVQLLFFVSGAAGLVYEVVWVRELTARFGSGVYAVGAVLASFMGGLALGATLFGRIADRLARPLLVYALLELLIAATAQTVPALMWIPELVDRGAYALLGDSTATLALERFAAACIVLLIPTTLMGATLPCLSRTIVSHNAVLGGRVGGLYAANTLGAVAGAFLSGFWLLEKMGISGSGRVAGLLNIVSALGAFWLAFRTRRDLPRPVRRSEAASAGQQAIPPEISAEGARREPLGDPSRLVPRLVFVGAFVTGFVALAAEILWSRSLMFVFDGPLKNTTYCFSAMLTVFLAGLGLGSALMARFADGARQPLRLYGLLVALQGATVALSVVILDVLQFRAAAPPSSTLTALVAANFARTAAVLALPTLFMGAAFPVAVRLAATAGNVARQVGGLYGVNTLGSVAATIVTPFLIVPFAGVATGLVILAGILMLLATIIVASTGRWRVAWLPLALLAGFIPVASLCHARLNTGHAALQPGESLVHFEESAVATVTVVQNGRGERRICVDDVPVAGTSTIMQTDQKSLAHLPMALCRTPRAALSVGFGGGGASYSFLLHDDLERVHCVEICPAVVRAAPFLTAANHGFLERRDPRYRLIFDDARAYLRCTSEQYDVISTDCTDLRYKSSANLYDLEYFDQCRRRLNPGGLVVVWLPLGGLSDRMFRATLRTFHRVFPETAVFYMHNEWTHYVLLAGWRERVEIDFSRVMAVLSKPAIRDDLAEIGLADPCKFVATFVTAGRPLAAYLDGDLLNTQDAPVLEFEGPRHMAGFRETVDANLKTLLNSRVSVFDWIVPGTIDARQSERLNRYVQAVLPTLKAQREEMNLDIEAATRSYLMALAATPEDESLRRALEFPKFVPLAEQGNPTVWLLLGRSRQVQERHREALRYFERYFDGCERLEQCEGGITDPEVRLAAIRQARIWRAQAVEWRQMSRAEIAVPRPDKTKSVP